MIEDSPVSYGDPASSADGDPAPSGDDSADGDLPPAFEELSASFEDLSLSAEDLAASSDLQGPADLEPSSEPPGEAGPDQTDEELIAETDYDADLGVEMAEDAQRVVEGELSEEEFHDRYHERVIEEFGEDARVLDLDAAVDGEDGGIEDLVSALAGDSDVSRRDLMKAGGAAAVGMTALSGAGAGRNGDGDGDGSSAAAGGDNAAAADGTEGLTGAADGDVTRWGMVINLNNCDGCLECVVACKGLHGSSRGAHWIYVMAYEDEDTDHENFFVRTCMHCADAPCEKVCPVGARHTREEDGLVLTDYDICIGCRYCMVSCPYGANYFQWGEPDNEVAQPEMTHDARGTWVDGPPPEGVMGKCTFEPAWQDGSMGEDLVGTTMCEQACTRDAIHFGDMNDPESDPNTHLREYAEAHENDRSEFENRPPDTVTTFRSMDERGTDPGVVFVGDEPGVHAEQVEGPVTYEEKGLLDRRKDLLDEGPAGNQGSADDQGGSGDEGGEAA